MDRIARCDVELMRERTRGEDICAIGEPSRRSIYDTGPEIVRYLTNYWGDR